MHNSLNTTRLLIADDHPLFRRGLRDVIEQEQDLEVIEEANTGLEAFEAIGRLEPDIAILDYKMPGMSGLDIARKLSARNSNVAVIILTMCDEDELFGKAVELGVMGYILKESAINEIVRGIKAVSKGKRYYSPLLAGRALHVKSKIAQHTEVPGAGGRLTPMEHTILALVTDYKSTAEIAEELCISPRTVENHRANICHKLNLTGRYSLLRYALGHRTELGIDSDN